MRIASLPYHILQLILAWIAPGTSATKKEILTMTIEQNRFTGHLAVGLSFLLFSCATTNYLVYAASLGYMALLADSSCARRTLRRER